MAAPTLALNAHRRGSDRTNRSLRMYDRMISVTWTRTWLLLLVAAISLGGASELLRCYTFDNPDSLDAWVSGIRHGNGYIANGSATWSPEFGGSVKLTCVGSCVGSPDYNDFTTTFPFGVKYADRIVVHFACRRGLRPFGALQLVIDTSCGSAEFRAVNRISPDSGGEYELSSWLPSSIPPGVLFGLRLACGPSSAEVYIKEIAIFGWAENARVSSR